MPAGPADLTGGCMAGVGQGRGVCGEKELTRRGKQGFQSHFNGPGFSRFLHSSGGAAGVPGGVPQPGRSLPAPHRTHARTKNGPALSCCGKRASARASETVKQGYGCAPQHAALSYSVSLLLQRRCGCGMLSITTICFTCSELQRCKERS